MQLINVLEGGKLIQDLDNGNERHRKEESDKVHSIIAEDDSLLHKVSGSLTGRVNSAHHQAIDPDGIGDNLMANAYDDDDEKIAAPQLEDSHVNLLAGDTGDAASGQLAAG